MPLIFSTLEPSHPPPSPLPHNQHSHNNNSITIIGNPFNPKHSQTRLSNTEKSNPKNIPYHIKKSQITVTTNSHQRVLCLINTTKCFTWHIYAMNWSICRHKKYRLAIVSLLEQYLNRVKIVLLDDSTGEICFDPNLSFEHPYTTTKAIFIPNKDCSRPDLLTTSSDFLPIWPLSDDANHVELKTFLNGNKNNEYCGPFTSFDWNEPEPKRIGTSSIETACTIWDIEKEAVDTQLIAYDKEVFDIA